MCVKHSFWEKAGYTFIPIFVVNENFDNPSYNAGREMILIRQIDNMMIYLDTVDVL